MVPHPDTMGGGTWIADVSKVKHGARRSRLRSFEHSAWSRRYLTRSLREFWVRGSGKKGFDVFEDIGRKVSVDFVAVHFNHCWQLFFRLSGLIECRDAPPCGTACMLPVPISSILVMQNGRT